MSGRCREANIRLHALLLADHIYREADTGKYIIAGTFNHLHVASFPTTFARTIGVFASFSGLAGSATAGLEFLDATHGETLMQMPPFEVSSEDPRRPVEFAVEVPPLYLPAPGDYGFRLSVDGVVVGNADVFVPATKSG